MQKDMTDFDWVRARSGCSLHNVFEMLRLQVQQDIAVRRDVRPKGEHLVVEFHGGGDVFAVTRDFGTNRILRVSFMLSENIILVRDTREKTMFKASVTLGEDGECRLKIGDKEIDSWQFRMMALENILFGGYPGDEREK